MNLKVSLVDEAFDDLVLLADARLARLRAEQACADAFAAGVAHDRRASLMAAASACNRLRGQGPLPPLLEGAAVAVNSRIVEMSAAQAAQRAALEANLAEAMEGDAWAAARDALGQAADGDRERREGASARGVERERDPLRLATRVPVLV
jgi:hypothetical protein